MSTIPRVLPLGDSIRMSYQPLVVQLLEGKADVVGPSVNCQYSLYTLSSLAHWIAELGKPDIVHWNNGIHDVGHNPQRSPAQMPIEPSEAGQAACARAVAQAISVYLPEDEQRAAGHEPSAAPFAR